MRSYTVKFLKDKEITDTEFISTFQENHSKIKTEFAIKENKKELKLMTQNTNHVGMAL